MWRAVRAPVETLRVGVWAWLEARRLASKLGRDGMEAVATMGVAPSAPGGQRATVEAALDLAGASCLVRAAVLQRWDAGHGDPRPLIIGVAKESHDGFAAHAWLEGDEGTEGFVELHRHLPG
jgi:hypothetical protein